MPGTSSTRPKVGRKRKDDIERTRSSAWAWDLCDMLKMDFAKAERFLYPDCYQKRSDGGGYKQPQRIRQYAMEGKSPIGNGRNTAQCALELADQKVPSSRTMYDSVLWSVLRATSMEESFSGNRLMDLAPEVLFRLMSYAPETERPWVCCKALSYDALKDFSQLGHPDVLAVLLIHLKLATSVTNRVQTVFLIRYWVSHAIRKLKCFAATQDRFLPLLEKFAPELGPLVGAQGVTGDKPQMELLDEAIHAVILKSTIEEITTRHSAREGMDRWPN